MQIENLYMIAHENCSSVIFHALSVMGCRTVWSDPHTVREGGS